MEISSKAFVILHHCKQTKLIFFVIRKLLGALLLIDKLEFIIINSLVCGRGDNGSCNRKIVLK